MVGLSSPSESLSKETGHRRLTSKGQEADWRWPLVRTGNQNNPHPLKTGWSQPEVATGSREGGHQRSAAGGCDEGRRGWTSAARIGPQVALGNATPKCQDRPLGRGAPEVAGGRRSLTAGSRGLTPATTRALCKQGSVACKSDDTPHSWGSTNALATMVVIRSAVSLSTASIARRIRS